MTAEGAPQRIELASYSQVQESGEDKVWINTTKEQDAALYSAGLRAGMLVRVILEVIPCSYCGAPAVGSQ